MTERYQAYLSSRAWLALREQVLRRDQRRCRLCGQAAEEVHHQTYARLYHERLSDLLSVCAACHDELHGKSKSALRTNYLRRLYR